jgi:Flp pilus assembly secretin CpaC
MSQSSLCSSGGFGIAWRLAASVCLALAASMTVAYGADLIEVTIDQAKVLQLPDKTSTVVVGNPVIADVTTLRKKTNTIVLTGKNFGETNLIALDADGKELGESIVRVAAKSDTLVVQHGMDRESYSCNPRCQPVVSLGDSSQYTADVVSQIQSRMSLQAQH